MKKVYAGTPIRQILSWPPTAWACWFRSADKLLPDFHNSVIREVSVQSEGIGVEIEDQGRRFNTFIQIADNELRNLTGRSLVGAEGMTLDGAGEIRL